MLFAGLEEDINSSLPKALEEAANGHLEIEIRLKSYNSKTATGIGSQESFERALRLFKAHTANNDDWKAYDKEEDTVKFYGDNYRSIQKAGENTIRHERKKPTTGSPLYSSEWPISVNFAVEIKEHSTTASMIDDGGGERKRTRWSFVYAPGGQDFLRVDFTWVFFSRDGRESLEFEIEIEVMPKAPKFGLIESGENGFSYSKLHQEMSKIAMEIMRYVYNTPILYSKPIRAAVMSAINHSFDPNSTNDTQIPEHFVNKPRTMEWSDFDRNTVFPLFPPEGSNEPAFAVTIKTDGSRVFVYYHSTGIYLFNPLNQMLLRLTDQNYPLLEGTMLDGEILASPNTATETNFKVWTFDCLFVRVDKTKTIKDYRQRPLMDRLKPMRYTCIKQTEWNQEHGDAKVILDLKPKTFIPFHNRETFYEANRKASKQNLVNNVEIFKSDGLVFTDMGPYLRDRRPSCNCKRRDKSCQECRDFNPSVNRKFKPVELLTIDFQMKMNEEGELELHVATGGNDTVPFRGTREIPVQATQFKHDYVDESGIQKSVDQINRIYEFQWSKVDNLWIPLRQRSDRIVPNGQYNARSNWKVIHNDIPKGILVGKLKGRKALHLMRKYQNSVKLEVLQHWSEKIKARLHEDHEKRRPRLFDIGSGYGGDVGKWSMTDFEVYALEPDAQRLDSLESRAQTYGMVKRIQTIQFPIQEYKKLESKVGTLIKKCDLVTSFHSMTLIYDNIASVLSFVRSLKAVINVGGTFICMAMDGLAIHNQLGNFKQLTMEGIKIQRSSTDDRKVMIKMVTSDASLARGQTEYLVDFDHLIATLESEGFELIHDSHLDTAALLSDAELWWSQMTRMIQMRYIGAKELPNAEKKLAMLSSILKGTMTSAQVESDQIIEIENSKIKVLNATQDQTFWLVGVLPGGSSFFHALLWCIDLRYRKAKGDINIRFDRVMQVRQELSEILTDADIPADVFREGGIYSTASCRNALAEYTEWCGNHLVPFIENQLGVNIHVLSWIDGLLQPVRDVRPPIFNPNRINVILHCHDNGRYEPVGRSSLAEPNLASFVFNSDDSMIQGLLEYNP